MRRKNDLIELGCVDCVSCNCANCHLGQTGRGRMAFSIDADMRNAQQAIRRAYAIATQGETAIVSPTQQELLKQLVKKTGEVADYFHKVTYPAPTANVPMIIPGATSAMVAKEQRKEIRARSRRRIMEGTMGERTTRKYRGQKAAIVTKAITPGAAVAYERKYKPSKVVATRTITPKAAVAYEHLIEPQKGVIVTRVVTPEAAAEYERKQMEARKTKKIRGRRQRRIMEGIM